MEKVGSLWSKKNKDGKKYLTGTMLGGIRVLIYPVKTKTSDKSPDYTISIEYPGADKPVFARSSGFQKPKVTEEDF